jgi:hypothetical protein
MIAIPIHPTSACLPTSLEIRLRQAPQASSALRRLLFTGFALSCVVVPHLLGTVTLHAQDVDPFLWLEDVEGERAMEWVLARNEESRAALRATPRYQSIYDSTLELYTSDDRIAYPSIHGDMIYNFWTDAERPRGVYRRTTWDEYLSDNPTWETVLDVEALAESEGKPWAFRGISCLLPEGRRCLINLSPGGSDANEVREFDLETKSFVVDGFTIPVSKNSVAWVDGNTLLGWLATAVFLELNGVETTSIPCSSVYDLVNSLASSDLTVEEIASGLQTISERTADPYGPSENRFGTAEPA